MPDESYVRFTRIFNIYRAVDPSKRKQICLRMNQINEKIDPPRRCSIQKLLYVLRGLIMNEQLENQLKADLLEACRICRERFKYNPTRFLQMLYEKGPVETAIELVSSPGPSEGFTRSWENGALYLTVEAHVIKPKYKPLFRSLPQIIDMARKRLSDYGYEEIVQTENLSTGR
jgi:hypothetical protein